jgi:adenylate cyclase
MAATPQPQRIEGATGRLIARFDLSSRAVAWLTGIVLAVAVVAANAIGAGVVFVLAAFVVPEPHLGLSQHQVDHIVLVNGVILAVYLPIAVVVGIVWEPGTCAACATS